MGLADAYLAQLGAPEDPWSRQIAARIAQSVDDAADCVRDEELLRFAAHPVVRFMIDFAAGRWPGVDASEDARWAATVAMARREIAINQAFGIDNGLGKLNHEVMDWIDERIGHWDDHTFLPLVHARVDRLLEAGRRGRQLGGHRLRRDGDVVTPRAVTPGGWALRHPSDHYFRSARTGATDDGLRAILDAQIDVLAYGYDQLAAQPAAWEQAELEIELDVLDPVAPGWKEPVATCVVGVNAGPASVGDRLGLRLVADPAARFDGTLLSLRAGEKWLTCADRMPDGTIAPADGTRRLAA